MTSEYALLPVSPTAAARVPLPPGQSADERARFLAALTADDLAAYDTWPIDPPLAPAPLPVPDTPTAGDEE